MPFQPINFANIAPQGNEFARNFVDTLSKGYQAGQMPAKLEREARDKEAMIKQRDIERAFKEELLKEQPEKFTSEQSLRKAQMQKALRPDAIVLGEIEKDMRGYDNIVAQHGADSLQAQLAKAILTKKGTFSPKGDTTNALDKAEASYQRAVQEKGADSPEAQRADQYRQRIAVGATAAGANSADLNAPTKPTITANQAVIQAIDNTLPGIKELKTLTIPREIKGMSLNPDASAKYHATVAGVTDALVSALKLPKTNESISLVKSLIERHTLESDSSYLKRLSDLEKDLKERKKKSNKVLSIKNVNSNPDLQPEETKILNGKTYHLVDGEWVY